MPRFPIKPGAVKNDLVKIKGSDFHHIVRVLRLDVGDKITLFEDGVEHLSEISEIGSKELIARILSTQKAQTDSPLNITLCQALAKGDKLDLVVEKTTELGISEFMPIKTERTQIKETKRLKRWAKIASEASKQSGRTAIPSISDPIEFSEALALKQSDTLGILFYEHCINPLKKEDLTGSESIMLFIGPEGGFTDEEVTRAESSGYLIRGLGPRTLRTETAGIMAVGIIQYLAGDLGGKG